VKPSGLIICIPILADPIASAVVPQDLIASLTGICYQSDDEILAEQSPAHPTKAKVSYQMLCVRIPGCHRYAPVARTQIVPFIRELFAVAVDIP
jgi:hypothetical protein